jgi:hypothetical protein
MAAPDADWWPPVWYRSHDLPEAHVIVRGMEFKLTDWRTAPALYDHRIYIYDRERFLHACDDLVDVRAFLMTLANPHGFDNSQE